MTRMLAGPATAASRSGSFHKGRGPPHFSAFAPWAIIFLGRGSVPRPYDAFVNQGSEFVCRDLDLWAYQRGVTPDFSRPGKPTDNAFIASFNDKLRSECFPRLVCLRLLILKAAVYPQSVSAARSVRFGSHGTKALRASL